MQSILSKLFQNYSPQNGSRSWPGQGSVNLQIPTDLFYLRAGHQYKPQ